MRLVGVDVGGALGRECFLAPGRGGCSKELLVDGGEIFGLFSV